MPPGSVHASFCPILCSRTCCPSACRTATTLIAPPLPREPDVHEFTNIRTNQQTIKQTRRIAISPGRGNNNKMVTEDLISPQKRCLHSILTSALCAVGHLIAKNCSEFRVRRPMSIEVKRSGYRDVDGSYFSKSMQGKSVGPLSANFVALGYSKIKSNRL